MTVVSMAPAVTIPSQRTVHQMNGTEAFHEDVNVLDFENADMLEEYFEDADPSVIEPTNTLIKKRQKDEARVNRHRRSRQKAEMKPRNCMLREVAALNARSTDNGGGIKKPKLPKMHKRRIRNGEVPNDLYKYHVTRYWKLLIKENKVRRREIKVKRALATV